MKFQLLPISLLVTLFFSSCISNNAATIGSVYDTDGHALIPGQEYYILPVIRGRGGGLTLMQHNRLCPLYVGQVNMEVSKGLPLIFRPANTKSKAVLLSTDINVEFSAATSCVQPTAWRLGDAEGAANKRYIITGAFVGNPGIKTVSNWFKIEKWGNNKDYKLVFCPSVCKTCKVVCGDVGVFNEGAKRFLGLNGQSFPVMFKKSTSKS